MLKSWSKCGWLMVLFDKRKGMRKEVSLLVPLLAKNEITSLVTEIHLVKFTCQPLFSTPR